MENILNVNNLSVYFNIQDKKAPAVENISFSIDSGEILGIAGESGAGKTVTTLSLLGLLDNNAEISFSSIKFKNKVISPINSKDLSGILGKDISIIFQDAMGHMDPMFTIGDQLVEILNIHERLSKDKALEKSIDILNKLGISSPEQIINLYPHQLSGGMAQRIIIASAILTSPSLLFADEPTSSLDVTLKNQILRLLWQVNKEFGTSIVLISHNIQILSNLCNNILIMYGGWIVEKISANVIFNESIHPYTIGLLNSIPSLENKKTLETIPGNIPDISKYPKGCRFQDRCTKVMEKCILEEPPEIFLSDSHYVKCWLAYKEGAA